MPSATSRSSGSASKASAAIRSALALTLPAARPTALPLITAARLAKVPTAYLKRRGGAGGARAPRHADPEGLGRDLGERGLVALALGGQPGGHGPRPVGLDPHVGALVRADP